MQQIKDTLISHWKMSSSAISQELVETIGAQVPPSTVWRSLARSGLHERIASKMETRLTIDLCKKISEVEYSDLMGQNFKYLAVLGCSLFDEVLESSTIMSVCRQSMLVSGICGTLPCYSVIF